MGQCTKILDDGMERRIHRDDKKNFPYTYSESAHEFNPGYAAFRYADVDKQWRNPRGWKFSDDTEMWSEP